MEDKSVPGWIKPLALAGILILLVISGNSRLGPLPPLGKFCNPFSGFWRNAEAGRPRDRNLRISGMHEATTIVYDNRGVPHIFAQNAHDLYLAQGYVTAQDRLWQMEIQSRSAAGTLAEVLGPTMLERDRFQRRLGIPKAAEKDLELIMKDEDAWEAVSAYSEGVNAYIESLGKADYPLEYKLMDYAPDHWQPLNTALLIKQLQWAFSGGGDDLPLTNTLGKFGPEFVRKFFPVREPNVEPVIPAGTPWAFLSPQPASAKADTSAPRGLFPGEPVIPLLPGDSALPAQAPIPTPKSTPTPQPTLLKMPDPGNGSNNFVVSGKRTQGGYPILANDPHLDLDLPSIWYEAQLSAPGVSAYGVSLPGSHAIILGFNHKIAWGNTNGHDDVFDWYRITFRDSTLSEYMHGSQWKPTRKVVETIRVRGGATVFDTVIYTHQGPLVLKSQERSLNRDVPSMHALRWAALDPSDEIQSFLRIMKSENFDEFSAALIPFHCPSQNFAFASVSGDIAMIHHGRFPRKWAGQGRFILDGAEPGNDWSGWIPEEHLPVAKNPARGWLFSANQVPTDSTYPYYLGSGYLNGERAKRLGQILADADSLTPAKAFGILMDDYDLHAAEVLPALLGKIAHAAFAPADSAALKSLAAWDYHHDPNKMASALFDQWWRQLYRSIWHDEFGDDTLRYQWPSKDRTRHLILEEPASDWYDDITTPAKETLEFLTARSFREACALIRNGGSNRSVTAGAPMSASDSAHAWKTWAEYRPVNIRHLAHIDAFSRLGIASGGCMNCVNALKSTHGPSWRMVVALDKEPRGYGIFPGGQSGNPGSPHYDDFIADWAAGKYYELGFLSDPGAGSGTHYRLQLRGK